MIKLILPIFLVLSMCACSSDVLEDENYIHIKKDQVVCKNISSEVIIHNGRSSYSEELRIKQKCAFFRTISSNYDSKSVAARKQLEADLKKYE